MKILLYSWNGYNEDLLELNLKKLQFDVVVLRKECKDYTADSELAAAMIQMINFEKAEAVISYNYFPIVSLVCDTCKIPYFSWIFDAPHATLYSKTAFYQVNQIGVFDRRFLELLNTKGITNAFHAPLAVDTDVLRQRYTNIPNRLVQKIGTPDISFVGSMYTDESKVNMYDMYRKQAKDNHEDESKWQQLDELIQSHAFDYDKEFINEDLTEINLFLKKYMERNAMGLGDNYIECYDDIIRESVLEKRVTVIERQLLMNAVAKHSMEQKYRFNLYTGSDTSKLGVLNSCNCGPVSYEEVMPTVFNRSKINLHISLRSIHTGMPLRVLDIMGCGGFLLSSYHEELLENFDEGVHCATYRSVEECLDKIDYYLCHDDERKKIAANGLERVRENFSYEKGLARLFGV